MYLQERVRGPSGSLIFAADGRSAVVLGLSRQLVGISFLGCRGFQYCGSLLASARADLFPLQSDLLDRAAALAASLTREFHLIGLNGIDFVARQGVPFPIEVNPRYSASMELVERAAGTSIFEMHVAAGRGRLPAPCTVADLVHGKAVVFARRTVSVPAGGLDIRDSTIADIPHPGERIERGRPICTVFAEAETGKRCRELLLGRAALVYRSLEAPARWAS
jgi:predicted ATP-grasp superfamily ATP-dependent carboligase